MPSFTLDGTTYEYLTPTVGPEGARSWEYGKYPKVLASVPLAGGGTVNVYARASRWTPTHINTTWTDDTDHPTHRLDTRHQRPPRHRLRMGHRTIPTMPRTPTRDTVG